MTRAEWIAWGASVLASVLFVVFLLVFGAPVWLAVGFGYLSFLILRLRDHITS